MNLIARPWIVVALLSLLALSPAHAGMTPKEVEIFKDAKAWAEKGEAEGQLNLGICYTKGEGVPKDQVQAVSWYRKAAEQGNASAQMSLGECYGGGKGVEKDFVQAVNWYRKASEQGYVLAQYNLGGCYANGEGVAKDQIEAYAYWNQGTVEYARKKLAALEKQMTAEQIAAGKKRTKELKRELEDKIYENALQKEFAAKIAEKPDGK
jgi:hypothetical protein